MGRCRGMVELRGWVPARWGPGAGGGEEGLLVGSDWKNGKRVEGNRGEKQRQPPLV